MVKSWRAPSNFTPPRLTYFPARLVTSIRASCGNREPALSARTPSTETSPARIMACALGRESARPRSTTKASRRLGVDFVRICNEHRLSATKYEVLCDGAQATGGVAVGREFHDGLGGEVVGDFVGALQSVDRGISGFLLGDVLARSLAEGCGGFFHVEDVVGDLEGPADGFAEAPEAGDIIGWRTGAERTGGYRGANQGGGLRAVNIFEHFWLDFLALGFDVGNLAADHAVDGASGAGNLSNNGHALRGGDWRGDDCFKGQGEQSVSR